jgi:DinB superfamily
MSLRKALYCVSLILLTIVPAIGQSGPKTAPQQLRSYFTAVDKEILEMAKDFPEDKYDFRLKPEMRSFGEVIVHVASGNLYADKAGRGEKVKWDELNGKDYKTKAAIVALLEKAIGDSEGTLKGVSDESLTKSIEPWLGVLQHSSEHYGLLVAYYRANRLVPPASRK